MGTVLTGKGIFLYEKSVRVCEDSFELRGLEFREAGNFQTKRVGQVHPGLFF